MRSCANCAAATTKQQRGDGQAHEKLRTVVQAAGGRAVADAGAARARRDFRGTCRPAPVGQHDALCRCKVEALSWFGRRRGEHGGPPCVDVLMMLRPWAASHSTDCIQRRAATCRTASLWPASDGCGMGEGGGIGSPCSGAEMCSLGEAHTSGPKLPDELSTAGVQISPVCLLSPKLYRRPVS